MVESTVLIPTPLRQYVSGKSSIRLEGKRIIDVLTKLIETNSNIEFHIFDEKRKIRSFINIYVNDKDIRKLNNENTELNDSDIISIIPSVAGGSLNKDEYMRYSRHLILPEVGMEGQLKLKNSSILLIGSGGLGSPTGLYLAAAGIGRLGIVDFDVVDLTNLQRQIIHSTSNIGKSKLQSAKERIREINPTITVETYETRLTSENALDIIKKYDIIIDGTDNFQTRYLVNDACVLLGKPNIYGSIFRFEGQASVFDSKNGPCYRCLYPEPPPPGLVPSCAEGGVLGVLPGVIGTIQATEAIKIIIGKGEPLVGRLLLYDAIEMRFRELEITKEPSCPICGENPTISELIDYEEFCGIRGGTTAEQELVPEITVKELENKIKNNERITIIDVREPHEYEICNIKEAKLIPLNDLPNKVNELDSSQEIILHCHTGMRSAQATSLLRNIGFTKASNLKGGIEAWSIEIDDTVPRY